ncbi:MAG: hypothetical protein N2490_06090 [Ignavibacteria bacterium]|nr:hypothetical protein [Ignavibacteria bacterium]
MKKNVFKLITSVTIWGSLLLYAKQTFSQYYSASKFNAILLCNDGKVMNWGMCNCSGCGLYNTCLNNGYISVSSPTPVNDLPGIFVQVSSYDNNFGALRNDGKLFLWGKNDYGQLGNNSTISSPTPQILSTINNVKYFGFNNTFDNIFNNAYPFVFAIKNDGTVWMWGNNTYGQLGIGNKTSQLKPVQVSNLNNIVKVSCGTKHCLALKNDGTVWAWGANDSLQLGVSNISEALTPIQVPVSNIIDIDASYMGSVLVGNDGKIIIFGHTPYPGPNTIRKIHHITNIKSAKLGKYHILLLKNDGNVYVIGENMSGVFGNGNVSSIIKDTNGVQSAISDVNLIYTRESLNAAIKNDGTLWVWGYNTVADNCTLINYSPCLINSSCALKVGIDEWHERKALIGFISPNPFIKTFSIKVNQPILNIQKVSIQDVLGKYVEFSYSIDESMEEVHFTVENNYSNKILIVQMYVNDIPITFKAIQNN